MEHTYGARPVNVTVANGLVASTLDFAFGARPFCFDAGVDVTEFGVSESIALTGTFTSVVRRVARVSEGLTLNSRTVAPVTPSEVVERRGELALDNAYQARPFIRAHVGAFDTLTLDFAFWGRPFVSTAATLSPAQPTGGLPSGLQPMHAIIPFDQMYL